MNKGFSSVLNASRWIAAMLVMISHVRHIVLADYKDVQNPNLLIKAFYFFTGFGTEAVVVFFVVSGLLVGGLTLEKWRRIEGPQMADYFIHRVSRIFIVAIPAILFGVLVDFIGINNFDNAQIYSNSAQYNTVSMNSVIKNQIDLGTILGNIGMLQNIFVSVVGSNGPLWSLAFEWWFYCLWAFSLGAFFYSGAGRIFSVVLVIAMISALPFELLVSMLLWLLGIVVFFYGRSSLPKPHPLVGLTIFLVVISYARLSHNQNNTLAQESFSVKFLRDFELGLAYSIALVSLYQLERPLWFEWMHVKLASFSYSLYIVHFPMMVLIVACLKDIIGVGFLQQPCTDAYLYFSTLVIVLYIYAFIFSLATEIHTYKLIRFFRRTFMPKKFG